MGRNRESYSKKGQLKRVGHYIEWLANVHMKVKFIYGQTQCLFLRQIWPLGTVNVTSEDRVFTIMVCLHFPV